MSRTTKSDGYEIRCPDCQKRMRVPDETMAGRKTRCRQCGFMLTIPLPDLEPSDAAASTHSDGVGAEQTVPNDWDSFEDQSAFEEDFAGDEFGAEHVRRDLAHTLDTLCRIFFYHAYIEWVLFLEEYFDRECVATVKCIEVEVAHVVKNGKDVMHALIE